MKGRTQTLPWWLGGEGVKTTEKNSFTQLHLVHPCSLINFYLIHSYSSVGDLNKFYIKCTLELETEQSLLIVLELPGKAVHIAMEQKRVKKYS
jgi:hypothetical protein